MTQPHPNEPNWKDGCAGEGVSPGKECADCTGQREHFGYSLVGGRWARGARPVPAPVTRKKRRLRPSAAAPGTPTR